MSKAMKKLKTHPDYPNVSDAVFKEFATERLEELKGEKEWIDNELAILKERLAVPDKEKTNETT